MATAIHLVKYKMPQDSTKSGHVVSIYINQYNWLFSTGNAYITQSQNNRLLINGGCLPHKSDVYGYFNYVQMPHVYPLVN